MNELTERPKLILNSLLNWRCCAERCMCRVHGRPPDRQTAANWHCTSAVGRQKSRVKKTKKIKEVQRWSTDHFKRAIFSTSTAARCENQSLSFLNSSKLSCFPVVFSTHPRHTNTHTKSRLSKSRVSKWRVSKSRVSKSRVWYFKKKFHCLTLSLAGKWPRYCVARCLTCPERPAAGQLTPVWPT